MGGIQMKPKKLSRMELLLTNVGIVVGSGVVTTTGLAIARTGRSVYIAYLIAVIFGLLQAIPTVFNYSIMSTEGGNYTLARIYGGPLVAGANGLTNVLNFFGNGAMSLALGAYVSSVFPSVNSRIAAGIFFTFFTLVNLRSTKLMAKVSSFLAVAMFVGLGAFVVFGLGHLNSNPFDFSDPSFFLAGASGVFAAANMLAFSTQSVVMASYYSSLSENPKKDVPWAIMATVCIIAVIYISVSLVAGNVLPVEEVAGKPLTAVAKAVMPNALAIAFVFFGPFMCLSSTINGGFATQYRPLVSCAKEGLLPIAVTKENKSGIPYRIVIVQYICGMFPILIGTSISTLFNQMMLSISLAGIFLRLCLFKMPKQFPEQWKKSHLHVPDPVYYLFCLLAIGVNLFFIVRSILSLTPGWVCLNFGILILSFAWSYIRTKQGKVSPRSITYSFCEENDAE